MGQYSNCASRWQLSVTGKGISVIGAVEEGNQEAVHGHVAQCQNCGSTWIPPSTLTPPPPIRLPFYHGLPFLVFLCPTSAAAALVISCKWSASTPVLAWNKTIGEPRSRGSSRGSAGAPVISKLCLSACGPIAAVHIPYVGFRCRGASCRSSTLLYRDANTTLDVTDEASKSIYTDRTNA